MAKTKKKIIVIGSGPGGTSAAALLASRGFEVDLFEKRNDIGGRCGSIQEQGYRFDVGPTFLMMKFLLDLVFEEAQTTSSNYLKFLKLDPMYELKVGNRSFRPSPDHDKTKASMEEFLPGSSPRFDQFIKKEKKRFQHLLPCIQRDYSSARKLISPALIKSVPYLGLGKSVFDVLKGYFKEEDLSLMFSFQSKYLGMSAWKCPGGFSMLSYIEHAYGIYHTEGGLAEIPLAFAKLAKEHGAKIHTGMGVKQLIIENRAVIGVELESGEKVYADEVVLNADFANAMTKLVPQEHLKKYTTKKLDSMKYSCSTFMIHLGLDKIYPLDHHTIVFADQYRTNVEDVFERHTLSNDFSFYVRNASINDPTLAPAGHSSIYILVPVPNLTGNVDWATKRDEYEQLILKQVAKKLNMHDLEKHIVVKKVIDPSTWESSLDIHKGATFNLSHNYGQLAYWRPRNKFEEFDRCYLVGGGTHPGSGLPTILESARIAANMISNKHEITYISKEVVF
jgi:phytoene desaturase